MQTKSFTQQGQRAFAARFEAQKIAFSPVVFQCVHYAWKRGMLQALSDAGQSGLCVAELAATQRWSEYALKVVLETCLSAGVVYLKENNYVLDKTGYCILTDKITQVNFDFNQDVCYTGMAKLAESLDQQKPLGLKQFGDWTTLYEGLTALPEPAKTSWFTFDHHYSDTSFPTILADIFATAPHHVMDIGANTGKFSSAALAYSPTVELHLVDLPTQLAVAEANLQQAELQQRAHFYPTDLLNPELPLKTGMDVIWMSQFLSCFSEQVIRHILQRALAALAPKGQVIIMDTFWDRQRYDIAAYCLINTSPYFTAIACGDGKIYQSTDYIRIAEEIGLRLLTVRDDIGYCHSLLRFGVASD